MRRWILLFVAGLVGLPLLLHAIALDDSFVVFVFGQTTVEMPLWFVIAAMLLSGVASYYLARVVRAVFLTPRRVNRWLDRRSRQRTSDFTLGGYLALLEGQWTTASRQLLKGSEKSGHAALNYLLGAQARVANDDLAGAEQLVHKAAELLPDAAVPVGIFHARLLQQAGVTEKAHDILQDLATAHPRHAYLQKLLVDSHRRRGDAATVLQILSRQHRQKPLQDPELLTELARLQIAHGEGVAAEALLRRQLERHWRPDWVTLYGQAEGQDMVRQLQAAEKWLAAHPDEPALLLALARLCQRNRLWAKARDYYEQYLRLQKDEAVARDFVQLLQALGETEKARQWLERIAVHHNALPLPPPPR